MPKHSPDDAAYRRLVQLINEWNHDHYDIFVLSQPNEDLEFHGVMRFFFQDAGAKVATKCIRVASTATAKEVVDVLVEKFHPDMRMLTMNDYNLYEVHVNGEERKLAGDECPLFVQLHWGEDMREGRFLLKCAHEITAKDESVENERGIGGFKRKLSKREKKEKKKREKERLKNKENLNKDSTLAEKLYTDVPENSFTRSISNPEAVIRRRRQQKVEKRLQFQNETGSESGGMLKIHWEALSPNVPYEILVSANDTAQFVVEETLDKYGVPKEESYKYCLVQVTVPKGDREYHGGSLGDEKILDDDECPLAIQLEHAPERDSLMFQLRLRPQDDRKKERMRAAVSHNDLAANPDKSPPQQYRLPYLLELHRDGGEIIEGRIHYLQSNVTEVGSEKSVSESGQYLQLFGQNILPHHCVIAHMDGSVTLTPTKPDAETFINDEHVSKTTLLQDGMIIRFGLHHIFRFCDSRSDEDFGFPRGSASPNLRHQPGPYGEMNDEQNKPFETTFELNGHVETLDDQNLPRGLSREDLHKSAPNHSPHSQGRHGAPSGRPAEVLPAILEFREEAEDQLLRKAILNTKCNSVLFKLAPTYTLYLAIRHCLSNAYYPDLPAQERAMRLTNFINKISGIMQQAIEESRDDPAALAFLMANTSETYNFIKQDQDTRLFSREAQEVMAESVQMAFHHLVGCLQYDLQQTMPAFVDVDDSVDDDDFVTDSLGRGTQRMSPTLGDVLRTLSAAMNLLRRCRVNAALTIQLFSQLFHFINMWLFNILIQRPNLKLCTRRWGIRLKRRLGRVEAWAEKQGLELAADCHLCRIIQAAHLLQAPKNNSDDIAKISSTCFKLNSLQVRALLQYYIPEDNEPHIPQSLIDKVVAVATNMADELAQSEGSEIRLEEDKDLQLPFLLPEDGYSCDIIRGVPNGLPEYLDPFTRAGICRLIPQPNSKGLWTVHMVGPDQQGPKLNELHPKDAASPHPGQGSRPEELPKEPEIIEVSFEKVKGSIGLSIVAAKGDGQMSRGIYIKSVVPGGAAALDGRLQAGDQLLEVDGRSLVGLSQEKAANLMTKTGNVVCLKVSKQGAIYHGLATLLGQPSPTMQRANGPKKAALMQQEASMKNRPRSEENLFNGPPRESERPQSRPKPDFRDNSLPRQQPHMNESRPPYSHPGPQSSPSPNSEGAGPNPRNNNMRYPPNSHPSANFPHPEPHRTPPHLNNQHSPRGEDPRSRSTSNLRQEEMAMYQKPLSPQQNMHGTIPANARNSSPSANIPGDDYRMAANKRSPPHRQPQPEPTPPQQQVTSQPYMNGNARQIYDQHPPYVGVDSSRYAGPMQRPLDQDPKMVENNRYIEQQHPRGQENVRHMNYYNKSEPGRYQHPATEPQRNNYSHQDRGNNYTPSPIPSYQQKPMTNHPSATNQSPASSLPKDDRPYSMATSTGSHDRPEFSNGQLRPHTDDISADKVREWQAKHDVDYSNNSYNSLGTLEQPKYPPYMESPEQKSVTSHYAKISAETREINNDIPKASVNNQARQQHFYEKTKQRIQEPAPPFHQLQRPGEQEAMKKPAVPPKTVSLKSVDKGPPINDIPRVNVHDGRPIQPQPQIPAQNVYNVRYAQQQKHVQSQPMMAPSTAEKFKGPDMMERRRDKHGLPELDHSDLPPPPEIPPDLPPPPAPEDLQEMPPPPQDFRVNYHSESQNWQQTNHRYNSPNDFGPSTQNYKLGNLGQRGPEYTESYRPTQVPPDQNNYKGYPAQVNNYEGHSYERRSIETGYQIVSSSRHDADSDQDQRLLYSQPNVSPPQPPVNISGASSAWEREEKTKIIKQEEMNMNRIRETEIRKLSEKKYRSPQEEDRLKKLCLEDEFQRRVQEVGDDEEDNESEPEITPYRQQSQEWLIKNIQEDLQKTLNRLREIDENRASEEYKKETERMQRLRQRLEIFEKERDEDRKRLQRRQQQKILEQEQHLQKQRELREKQRRDFEEQRKIHLMEEEKMRERKMEDLRRKKELEREQIQAAREAEEEIRRRNEEKKLQEQQMRSANRYNDLPTSDYNSINNYNAAYLDPGPSMSFPPPPPLDKSFQPAPQPPERGSSYETLNQYQMRGGMKVAQDQGVPNDIPSYNSVGRSTSTSALRSNPDITAPKKSVSFNTQLETRITPSFSSYPSSSSSHASDQYNPTNSPYHEKDDALASPTTPTSDVFDVSQPQTPTSPPPVTHPKPTEVHYRTAEVPGVIGSQEVYRDPRTRIQAKKAASSAKMPGPERMSFRDKMKYFAQEAGENTPKEKPKASRVQRNIESAMNGQ